MQKMHISFLKELRNFEFYDLFVTIDLNLDNGKIKENSFLHQAAKTIKDKRKQLLLLKHANLAHPLTKVINDKVQPRTEYLACLRMRINAGLLSHLPEERAAGGVLKV